MLALGATGQLKDLLHSRKAQISGKINIGFAGYGNRDLPFLISRSSKRPQRCSLVLA
jgi:hypothetical protein